MRILSESASARLSTPDRREARSDRRQCARLQSARAHMESPGTVAGGEWHLRDIVDYQLIAFESVLYQAAFRRADMLQAAFIVSANALPLVLLRGRSSFLPPSAIPARHASCSRRSRSAWSKSTRLRMAITSSACSSPTALSLRRCSNARSIPICGSIPAVRPSALTTSRRTRCRYCSAST